MITALIVDDEPGCRESLQNLLARHCPEVQVIGQADSPKAAREIILSQQPQLVFLDVEMPMGTGFDLLKSLPAIDFSVIFVTAYDHYAIKAFRVSAVDYLLKPVDVAQLKEAVGKVKAQLNDSGNDRLQTLLENVSGKVKKVAFPTGQEVRICKVDTIVRARSEDNYCHVYFENGTSLFISKTIKWVAELLEGQRFLRVHQSHLINLDHVEGYTRTGGGEVFMSDGEKVPVSSRKKDELLKALNL